MELVLNLEWVALAITMFWLWLRHAPRDGRRRSVQVISLALVLATMFIVITMYDDMAMAQHPAEMRCFQREDDCAAHAQISHHPGIGPASALVAGIDFPTCCSVVLCSLPVSTENVLLHSPIGPRPPPAA